VQVEALEGQVLGGRMTEVVSAGLEAVGLEGKNVFTFCFSHPF
jgi:hypothetical protein